MKNTIFTISAIGLLAVATPANAQMVNGGTCANGSPVAPIGAKSGGSPASMQAPGAAAAVAGARENNRDFKKNRTGDISRSQSSDTTGH